MSEQPDLAERLARAIEHCTYTSYDGASGLYVEDAAEIIRQQLVTSPELAQVREALEALIAQRDGDVAIRTANGVPMDMEPARKRKVRAALATLNALMRQNTH